MQFGTGALGVLGVLGGVGVSAGNTEGLYTVVLKMRNFKGQIDAGAGGAGGANYAFGGQVNASK